MKSFSLRSCAASFLLLCIATGFAARAEEKASEVKGKVKCHMTFTLAGWSAFYKTAKGNGTITCDNAQTARVALKTTGGGLTFGKSKTVDGKGVFSDVSDIGELFGSYATATAHAGVVKSAEAQALTKGEVSLALSGTGAGVDLGIDFGKFTITKK